MPPPPGPCSSSRGPPPSFPSRQSGFLSSVTVSGDQGAPKPGFCRERCRRVHTSGRFTSSLGSGLGGFSVPPDAYLHFLVFLQCVYIAL